MIEKTLFESSLCPLIHLEPCARERCILYIRDIEDSHASHCMLRETCRWIIAGKGNSSSLVQLARGMLAELERKRISPR